MNEPNQIVPRHTGVVLIVDDNPENLKVLGDFFTAEGFNVRVARDGKQALASAEAEAPDIILLDIHMPVMDGYETCERIRQTPSLRDCPVVFLSALGETFNKVQAFECGGSDYITKPFNLDEVRVRINNHLQSARLLAENRAGFRASFEQAAVGMAHLSMDGGFEVVNNCLRGMFGFTEAEWAEKCLETVATPESAGEVRDALDAVRAGASEHPPLDVDCMTASDSGISCRITLSPVTVPSTGKQYITAIIEDVTAHRKAEAERLRLAAALEQTAEAIAIIDTNGVTQYVNAAYESAFGVSAAEMLGTKLPLIAETSPEYPRAAEVWEAIEERGVWNGRVVMSADNGRPRTAEYTLSPVRNSGGTITNYIAVGRDLTRQLQLEEQLRQSQKMEAIGTLAAGIAHDFNNLLAAIMGFTQLTIEELPEGDRIRENLQEVVIASQHAADLVSQILAFGRQSAMEIRPVHLQETVHEAVKLLRRSIPPTIEIRTRIDEECGPVLADPTTMQQILMNLCTNAYHAMEDSGGELSVVLSEVVVGDEPLQSGTPLAPGKYTRLDVSDTGHGMDKETVQRIFEPYFTTKDRGQGTGLGLATVHGIVSGLSGAISVYSEPGSGSTFTIFLPTHSGDTAVTAPRPALESLPGDERILFIDDERSLCAFAEKALGRLGYRVTAMTAPEAAAALFEEDPHAFDLVITDEMMPGLRGSELLSRFRQARQDIPVILYSGFSETLRPKHDAANAFSAYVVKPLVVSDLTRAIRSVCGGDGA